MQTFADPRSAPPTHHLTASEFVSNSIVLPVRRSGNPASVARMVVSDEFKPRLEQFKKAASAALRALGSPDHSNQLVQSCLDKDLRGDLWHSRLPNGTVVILVREELLEQVSERDLAEQVHRGEVDAASMRGEAVPAETLAYYRERPGVALPPRHV